MTATTRSNPPTHHPRRQIGVLSTTARVLTGAVLVTTALLDADIHVVDLVLGLGVANLVVFVVLAARGHTAAPLRLTGPPSHVVNIGLIFAFYTLNPVAASLFYGSAMLLAAARGYAACEMFAVWNWARRRDDQFACPFFLPVDILEQHLTGRRHECA